VTLFACGEIAPSFSEGTSEGMVGSGTV